MMYTEQDIIRLRCSARHYELDAGDYFWSSKPITLTRICNGAGPESWSEISRSIMTNNPFMKRYESAFAIHDTDYEYKYCTKKQADKRFLKNMLKIWKRDFRWKAYLTISGLLELRTIIACYLAVRAGGQSAWENGWNNI